MNKISTGKQEIELFDRTNIPFTVSIKPPIGLTPRKIHEELVTKNRSDEICGAIIRYIDAKHIIPIEWIEEYNELQNKISPK